MFSYGKYMIYILIELKCFITFFGNRDISSYPNGHQEELSNPDSIDTAFDWLHLDCVCFFSSLSPTPWPLLLFTLPHSIEYHG